MKGMKRKRSPGDGRGRCRGGLQSQVGSICASLLHGTLQVAPPLEMCLQQGLTAGSPDMAPPGDSSPLQQNGVEVMYGR
ncbi:MAG: hypothetical protein FRX49_05952 [Trebouxia sp. A1-2]|nr:MAG: hypothetical protein FRX49_05952 [Trebouxia sp. A1-2]